MKKISAMFALVFLIASGHAQIFPYVESFDSYTANQPLNGNGGITASSHVYVTPYGVVGNCAEFQMAASGYDTITSPVIGPLTAHTVTSFYFRAVTITGGVPSVYNMTASDSAVIYVGTSSFNISFPQYTIKSSDQNTNTNYVKVVVPVPAFLNTYSGRFRIITSNPAGNNWKLEFDSLVVRDTMPVPPVLNDSVTNIACRGQNTGGIKVFASGATATYTYLWSPGGDTISSITAKYAGVYTVTVTDHLGVTASLTDSIRQPALALLLDSLSKNQILCYGSNTGEATIYASGGTRPYHYNWSTTPAVHTDSAVGLYAGNYNVTVTDASGCSLTAAAHISQPSVPYMVTGSSTQSSTGSNGTATVVVSGGTGSISYTWSNAQSSSSISGLAPGLYEVTVSDGLGCKLYDTVFVAFPNGINEADNSLLSLFPNPAADQVYVEWKGANTAPSEVLISDMSGRIVIAETSSNTINTSSLSNGVYVVRINVNDKVLMRRLTIQR